MKKILIFIAVLMLSSPKLFAQTDEETLKEALTLADNAKYEESNNKLLPLYAKDYSKYLTGYNIALNYYMLKNYRQAQKFASTVVNANCEYSLQASVVLGRCYNINKKYKDEQNLYTLMSQKYPNEEMPFYCLGQSFIEQKNFPMACKNLQKGLEINFLSANIHFKLAEANNSQELYAQSFLAGYFFLLAESNSARSLIVINDIFKAMNITDIDQVIARKEAENNSSAEDRDLVSAMLFINNLKKSSANENTHLPDPKIFIDNSSELLKNIVETCNNSSGFYENHYVKFFDSLIKAGYLDAFLYCSTVALTNKDAAYFPNLTKENLLEFAAWLKENLSKI